MGAVGAWLLLEEIGEYAPETDFAARYPRAEKYIGWPMLLILRMRADLRLPDPVPRRAGPWLGPDR